MPECRVCQADLAAPVFRSTGATSVTSMCELVPRETTVYYCTACGHLQTEALNDLGIYYDEHYRISLASDDEDQLYQVDANSRTFRTDHQANTLLRKVNIPAGALVLDFGCAKGTTMKRVVSNRPDIVPHLFDVSAMYTPYWESFAQLENCATYKPKPAWLGRFDLVTSFFVLEHVADLRQELATIHALLREGGRFYCIVPDVLANIADFVVVDHISHFSEASLTRALQLSGFTLVEVDRAAHIGAIVAISRKSEPSHSAGTAPYPHSEQADEVSSIAMYWNGFADRVRQFEDASPNESAAIYGSGFYGTFIASCLRDVKQIWCFMDQSPFQQGKTILDRPVVSPDDLPNDVRRVYVGLNPSYARTEIERVESLRNRKLEYFYL